MNYSWTNLADIKQLLIKRWEKGLFLRAGSVDLFPYRVNIRRPTSRQLEDDFTGCQKWVKQYAVTAEYNVEWKTVSHRKLGKNRLPVAIQFSDLDFLLRYIKKSGEYKKFQQLSSTLLQAFPALSGWIDQYPFKIFYYAGHWTSLIRIIQWMLDNPESGIYIRQIKLPEVDTKLIEQHKKLLSEWLDILLPAEQIQSQATGVRQFERRYGFRAKPVTLRFRILDPEHAIGGLTDISVTAEEFHSLELDIDTLFVTENDINGLAFPDCPKAIVLFGRGYGFTYLEKVSWLKDKRVFYWGDIDTHGFAILNQFRQHLPQTQSLLMDEATLMNHKLQWVTENKSTLADLTRLTEIERRLYNKLRYNQIRKNLRLEQEYVSYSALIDALEVFVFTH
ncbi:MAG: Wadjet anti-phage system protein JetD domain-containing protein [Gammaproteobacteria bacterium]